MMNQKSNKQDDLFVIFCILVILPNVNFSQIQDIPTLHRPYKDLIAIFLECNITLHMTKQ